MKTSTNPKNGDQISRLAFGCMRFPRNGLRIDQNAATELVRTAIEGGVNFFDTAYIYEGSERALGTALQVLGARDRVFIGDKLPIYLCKKTEDFDRFLQRQLDALQTNFIDYYFMHMLGDLASWQRLQDLGIEPWLEKQREQGKIRNVGFSFHGNETEFLRLLEAYSWDFTMIQYNYIDEHKQAGKKGLRAAYAKGMPVFVMEPLRGGSLVNDIPDDARQAFAAVQPGRKMADWGLRWLFDQPEVCTVLSGMNRVPQLQENITTTNESTPGMLTGAERRAYKTVVRIFGQKHRVSCTNCRYCLPCPRGVDIPGCFQYYNESFTRSYKKSLQSYVQTTGLLSAVQSDASLCTACGACESRCPQQIPISKELIKVKRRMMPPALPVLSLARSFLKIGNKNKK